MEEDKPVKYVKAPRCFSGDEAAAFRRALKNQGKNQGDVADYLDLNKTTFSNKKNGEDGRGFTKEQARKMYGFLNQDEAVSFLADYELVDRIQRSSLTESDKKWSSLYGDCSNRLKDCYLGVSNKGRVEILGALEDLVEKYAISETD